MGKYSRALERTSPAGGHLQLAVRGHEPHPMPDPSSIGERLFVPVPSLGQVPSGVARCAAVRALSERLAPLAAVDDPLRLLIAGCRPKDGTSTIAIALAVNLSQRLNLRTILVDAHPRNPALHRFFDHPARKSPELLLDDFVQIRSTGWPRLDLAGCCLTGSEQQRSTVVSRFERLFSDYRAAVIDLGVPRLDARMLPLARPDDPILLVSRFGHSERRELATTASALRAANRAPAGVILNDRVDPVPKTIRRLIGG
jgi:Mrp family chromosome partitioning ATPase